mgnify:CR=1 FL=1
MFGKKKKKATEFLKDKFNFDQSMEKMAVEVVLPMGLLSERLGSLDLEDSPLEKANVIVSKQSPWLDFKQSRDMFGRSKAFQSMYSSYMRKLQARDKCVQKIYERDPGNMALRRYPLKDKDTGKEIDEDDIPEPVDLAELQEEDPIEAYRLMFYLESLDKIEEAVSEMGKHLEECKHHMLGFSYDKPQPDRPILISKPIINQSSPYVFANKDMAKSIEDGWKEEEKEK